MRIHQPILEWGWTEVLLNRISYLLEILVWQQTEDGRKGRNQPEIFKPSFIRGNKKDTGMVMTTDQLDAILSKPRR